MSKPSPERVRQVLSDVLAASPYVKASALVRVNGLIIEAMMPPEIERERVSAMSAVMLLLGERIAQDMQSGRLDKVYIKGADGHILLMAVGREAVLTVQANDPAPLGLLFVEMRRAVQKLKKLL